MALAGITLGALAPTTAQAAHTGVIVDDKGNANATTTEGGEYVDLGKGASAYATVKQSADATSDANVQVVSGFLSLDAVPDFSFGRAIAGKTANLINGQSAIKDDGNQDGLLQITESRKTDGDPKDPAAKNTGFNLSAQLGQFENSANPETKNSDFKLNLMAQPLRSAEDGSPAGINTNAVTLNADGKTTQNVLSATPKDGLYGTYKVLFNSNDSASLYVPKGTDTQDSVSKWKGVITWTLSTTAAQTPNTGK